MVNTRQLEKKWYKYKARKLIFLLLSLFLLISLLGGVYYSYIQFIEKKSTPVEENNVSLIKLTNSFESKPVENVEVSEKEILVKAEVVSLEPIIPIIDMEKEERKKSKRVSVRKPRVVSHKSNVSKNIKAKQSAYLTANELKTMNHSLDSRQLKKINMTSISVNYIETIKQKFIATKNPREALLLARAYYAKGEYSKSEEWALRANKLNNKLEESWLLFAKSKAKLGKKEESLKILLSYYKKSRSSKAKMLIEKIKTERL